tara:strand:+ start:342 stop:527 length:186 start_codon:yes stop_codon:yes gene_type:complete
MQAEQKTWQYNPDYSYQANMSSWIDAVNFERKQYNETILTREQAEMKFQEVYPKEDYHGST